MAINNGMDFDPRPEARSSEQIVLKGLQEAASLRSIREPTFSFRQRDGTSRLEARSQFGGGNIFGYSQASVNKDPFVTTYMFYNTDELGPVILQVISSRRGEYKFLASRTQDISIPEIVAYVRDEKTLPKEKIGRSEYMEVSQGERIYWIPPTDGKNEFFPYAIEGNVPDELLQAIEDLQEPSRKLISEKN